MPLKVSSAPMGSWMGTALHFSRSCIMSTHAVEVGAHDVHLVDIHHAGYVILVGLTPHGLRLGLHAALGAQNSHRAVQHAQGTLHLNGEVHVARGVDDVDPMAVLLESHRIVLGFGMAPITGGGSRSDGDATLLLLRHPVHGSCTIMGLADLVVNARIVQNTLGGGGFACVDMSHDTDISRHLQRNVSWGMPCL